LTPTISSPARSTRGFPVGILIMIVLALCVPGRLRAHPHIFIEQRLTAVFDDKGLAGIHVNWLFDDMFSSMIVADHDINKNQSLEPGEVVEIKAKAFSFIAEYHYFFTVAIDGLPFTVNYVTDFNAELDQGRLTYTFFIPCHVTALPAPKKLKIATYDPEYYTAVYFPDKAPYGIVNDARFNIRAEIKEDKETLFYFDMVHPWTLFLEFALK